MKRLHDIDRAKGLAIFLVVLGHLARGPLASKGAGPIDAEWYVQLKILIYMFHMPFFMFLSGVVFFYTYKHIQTFTEYANYVINKIKRFIPAYLLFGLLILFGKIVASYFIYVDNVNYNVQEAIIELLVFPSESVAGSIWYIYVLLELLILIPLLLNVTRNNLSALLIIGVAAHFAPTTQYFMIDRLFEYILYFLIGIAVISKYDRYQALVDRYYKEFFLLFIASFFTIIVVDDEKIPKLIIGLCSIPALHGIVRLKLFTESKFLYILGKYTYSIYLINTIAIGVIKGIIFEFTHWNGLNFLLIAPILLASGIMIPILIKKHIFIRITYLNKLTS